MNKVPLSIPSNAGFFINKVWDINDTFYHSRILISNSGMRVDTHSRLNLKYPTRSLFEPFRIVKGARVKIPFGFYLTIGYERLPNGTS